MPNVAGVLLRTERPAFQQHSADIVLQSLTPLFGAHGESQERPSHSETCRLPGVVTSDDKALVAELTRNLAAKRRSEADDMATLIAPVVAHLVYETATVSREYPIARKRADMALWDEGASPAHAPTVILEAKREGTDFGSGPGSPLRQIEGYMVAEESSPDVWGVLTDGVRWRVLRRKGSTVDCVGVVELELPGDPDAVAELRSLIGYRVSVARMARSPGGFWKR